MELFDLKRIGLTEGEIKVYDAILALGETTKTDLAKRSGISPSNIYDVTNRLLEKGMISKTEKNGVAHFAPANPRKIVDYLESKKDEVDSEIRLVKDMLPTLLARFAQQEDDVRVEVFNGWEGLRTVFADMLNECKKGDANYVFGASKGEREEAADSFFIKCHNMRESKGIKTAIIFNKELESSKRAGFFQGCKNTQVRFLNQQTPSEIMIYKDTTCIIILTKNPLIIRIRGEEVRRSFRAYFDIMWAMSR